LIFKAITQLQHFTINVIAKSTQVLRAIRIDLVNLFH